MVQSLYHIASHLCSIFQPGTTAPIGDRNLQVNFPANHEPIRFGDPAMLLTLLLLCLPRVAFQDPTCSNAENEQRRGCSSHCTFLRVTPLVKEATDPVRTAVADGLPMSSQALRFPMPGATWWTLALIWPRTENCQRHQKVSANIQKTPTCKNSIHYHTLSFACEWTSFISVDIIIYFTSFHNGDNILIPQALEFPAIYRPHPSAPPLAPWLCEDR